MRRHALDAISLVFGLIFAATGAVFLFGNVDISQIPPAWTWPIPLMIVGALIILLAVRRDRPEDRPADIPLHAEDGLQPRHTAELTDWPPADVTASQMDEPETDDESR